MTFFTPISCSFYNKKKKQPLYKKNSRNKEDLLHSIFEIKLIYLYNRKKHKNLFNHYFRLSYIKIYYIFNKNSQNIRLRHMECKN